MVVQTLIGRYADIPALEALLQKTFGAGTYKIEVGTYTKSRIPFARRT